jgi:hypothetical protein
MSAARVVYLQEAGNGLVEALDHGVGVVEMGSACYQDLRVNVP